jgi:hypothetical protein
MWRAFGMRNELRISEEHGRFYIRHFIGRTPEEAEAKGYYVHEDGGRLICFQERSDAVWFCETATEHGLEEAKKQLAAEYQVTEVSRPDDIRKKLAAIYRIPRAPTPSEGDPFQE